MKLHDTTDVLIGGYMSKDAAEEDYNAVLDSGGDLQGIVVVSQGPRGQPVGRADRPYGARGGARASAPSGSPSGCPRRRCSLPPRSGRRWAPARASCCISKTADKIGEQAGETIPLGGAGLIVAYSHSEADEGRARGDARRAEGRR